MLREVLLRNREPYDIAMTLMEPVQHCLILTSSCEWTKYMLTVDV